MTAANLKKEIFSDNYAIALSASKKLTEISGDDIYYFLIELLGSKDPSIRNLGALALRKRADNRAILPLLNVIFKSSNKAYSGTLVYALQKLDCKEKLVEIFKILFYHEYESKLCAYNILDKQIFEFTRADLMSIQTMWLECQGPSSSAIGFDDIETKAMMHDAYEGFMDYLNQ